MTKTATITKVGPIKSWNGTNGTIFYHSIQLDNGDAGSLGKKSEGAVKEGDQITYKLEHGDFGNKIKEIPTAPAGRGSGSGYSFNVGRKSSTASFALSYAKDLAVANIAKADRPMELNEALAKRITNVASIFQQWLSENE